MPKKIIRKKIRKGQRKRQSKAWNSTRTGLVGARRIVKYRSDGEPYVVYEPNKGYALPEYMKKENKRKKKNR